MRSNLISWVSGKPSQWYPLLLRREATDGLCETLPQASPKGQLDSFGLLCIESEHAAFKNSFSQTHNLEANERKIHLLQGMNFSYYRLKMLQHFKSRNFYQTAPSEEILSNKTQIPQRHDSASALVLLGTPFPAFAPDVLLKKQVRWRQTSPSCPMFSLWYPDFLKAADPGSTGRK